MIFLILNLISTTGTFYSMLTCRNILYNKQDDKSFEKLLIISKFKYDLSEEILNEHHIDDFIELYDEDQKKMFGLIFIMKFHYLIFKKGFLYDDLVDKEIYDFFSDITIEQFNKKKKQLWKYEKILQELTIQIIGARYIDKDSNRSMARKRFVMAYVTAIGFFIKDSIYEKIKELVERKSCVEIGLIDDKEYRDTIIFDFINDTKFEIDMEKTSGRYVVLNLDIDNIVEKFVDAMCDLYESKSIILISFPFEEIIFYCTNSVFSNLKYNIKSSTFDFIKMYENYKKLIFEKFHDVTKIKNEELFFCQCEKKCEIIFNQGELNFILSMLTFQFNADIKDITEKNRIFEDDFLKLGKKLGNIIKGRFFDRTCKKGCKFIQKVFIKELNAEDVIRKCQEILDSKKDKQKISKYELEKSIIRKRIQKSNKSF